MASIPKVTLIQAPTPLHRLERLSADLGLDLWIKRDDLTGFAMGGNKGRKLEMMLADAIDKGVEVIVTCGALQSNFIRQLGAACSVFGIQCAAAVMATPYEYQPPFIDGLRKENGNLLLDELLGVDLWRYADGTWEDLYRYAEDVAESYETKGKRVYRIPVGGSSPLGAYAFWEAGRELQDQVQNDKAFDWIVFASSSGSTQVGLCHFFRGTNTKVLGIASDPEPDISEDFADLSRGLAELLGDPPLSADEFRIHFDMVGPGYGIPSKDGMDAIQLVARREGIFLDPIYSGKAFAGLLELAKRKEISGRVCFWHTGGVPTLFAL